MMISFSGKFSTDILSYCIGVGRESGWKVPLTWTLKLVLTPVRVYPVIYYWNQKGSIVLLNYLSRFLFSSALPHPTPSPFPIVNGMCRSTAILAGDWKQYINFVFILTVWCHQCSGKRAWLQRWTLWLHSVTYQTVLLTMYPLAHHKDDIITQFNVYINYDKLKRIFASVPN